VVKVKVDSIKNEFLKRLEGHPLEALTPPEGIHLMLSFYREERVEGCDLDANGDMLLYQWGTYDGGEGELFEFDITRQLIVGDGEDDDIFQLSLTFKFQPAESLRQLGKGNHWCHSPEELEELQAFISGSPAFLVSGREVPSEVQLEYGIAG
jgi:hypothetical protein